MRIWMMLYRKQKILKHITLEGDRTECMEQMAKEWDVSQPLWLPKHEREWDEYGYTRFRPDDFVDHFPFDALEVRNITEAEPDAKS